MTFLRSFLLKFLKLPPEAVIIIRLIVPASSPFKHCIIAECSLSTGINLTPYFLTNLLMISPPITNVSLLAKAIFLFFLIASIVGSNPALPTRALITKSSLFSPYVAAFIKPDFPYPYSILGNISFNLSTYSSLPIDTNKGLNSFIISIIFFML